MKYLSLFSGIEAATVAWHPLGWTPAAFAEIDRFPSTVLKHHFPEVENLGDITKVTKERLHALRADGVALVVGGAPCFPAGTPILTLRGLVPIEAVTTQDQVLGHDGAYHRVLRTGSKLARTVIMKGQGHWGLTTTANHPFLSSKIGREWIQGSKKRTTPFWRKTTTPLEWVGAGRMAGRHWVSPSQFPALPIPPIVREGREKSPPRMNAALFWFVGAWLGDGWTSITKRRGTTILCGNFRDEAVLRQRLAEAGLPFTCTHERTTVRFQACGRAFARWLLENFGAGSGGKTFPAWAFGMDHELRKALYDGYAFADGYRAKRLMQFTTINPNLAVGVNLLAASLGLGCSLVRSAPRRELRIEGRRVNEKPFFTAGVHDHSRSSFEKDGYRYGLVRSVKETNREEEVFDLEVSGSHSYVAAGLVVHNCQSFSVAGLRRGLDDPRGNLTLEFLRVVAEVRPRWVVFENVPGLLSSSTDDTPEARPPDRDLDGIDRPQDGEEVVVEDEYEVEEVHAFACLLSGLQELGYGCAWRVLDAQYFALAQRRERLFVVGCLGNPAAARAVLLERASLSGDPPPRRTKGPDPAAGPAACLRSGGSSAASRGARSGIDDDTLVPEKSKALAAPRTGGGGSYRGDSEVETLIPEVAGAMGEIGGSGRPGDSPDGAASGYLVPEVYENHAQDSRVKRVEVSPQINAKAGTGGGNLPLVTEPGYINPRQTRPGSANTSNQVGIKPDAPVADALGTDGPGAVLTPGPQVFRKGKRAQSAEDDETWVPEDVANTLNGFDTGDVRTTQAVVEPFAVSIRGREGGAQAEVEPDGVAPVLRNSAGGGGQHTFVAAPEPQAVDLQNTRVGGDVAGTLDTTRPSRGGGQGVMAVDLFNQTTHPETHAPLRTAGGHGAPAVMTLAENGSDVQAGGLPHLRNGHGAGTPKVVGFTPNDHGEDAGEELSPTLRSGNGGGQMSPGVVAPSLTASNDPSRSPQSSEVTAQVAAIQAAQPAMRVRRLTPRECCRLQGFPDDFTKIPYRGKSAEDCPDGPRYKALGNSMAVPCMFWIGQRIRVLEEFWKEVGHGDETG